MSTDKKQDRDTLGLTSSFQPLKAMALGQIQAASFVNKRVLACLELPKKLAACRSPDEFMQVNQSFLQTAWHDYFVASQTMMSAWDETVSDQTTDESQSEADHDYLALPKAKADGAETAGEEFVESQKTTPATQKRARPKDEIGQVGA